MSVSVFEANERSTVIYSCSLKDESGAAIEPASLYAISLTLYSMDSATEAIVNSRNNVDVKNVNGGTISSGGVFSYEFTSDDNQILESWRHEERHRAIFTYEWNAGARQDNKEVILVVRNKSKVT